MKRLLCLLLCICMLGFMVGCESVESGNSVIVSGALDATLEYLNGTTGDWQTYEGDQATIGGGIWEPGYVSMQILRVANEGTLDFKWQISLAAESLTELADVIDVYVKLGVSSFPSSADEIESWQNCGALSQVLGSGIAEGLLQAKSGEQASYETLAVALRMRLDASEDYRNTQQLGSVRANLLVTQHSESEEDAFENAYDPAA